MNPTLPTGPDSSPSAHSLAASNISGQDVSCAVQSVATRDQASEQPSVGSRKASQKFPIPPFFTSGWTLLLFGCFPQLVLAFVNWQAWTLVRSEISREDFWQWVTLGLLHAGLFAGSAFHGVTMLRGRKPVRGSVVTGLMVLDLLLLAASFLWINQIIPVSVAAWLLPSWTLVYHHFIWLMPLALYGALRIAFKTAPGDKAGMAIGQAFAVFALVLGGGYLAAGILGSLLGFTGSYIGILVIACYLLLSILCVAYLIRACVGLYVAARRTGPLMIAAVGGITGILLPLVGLAVNKQVPFPANFQLDAIYIMAVVTGISVSLPYFANAWAHRVVWAAQALCYPFTVYFFLTFLAVLPLLVPGILIMGAGLLIAVPSLLFFLHTHRLIDAWLLERRGGGAFRTTAAFGGAILLWPGIHLAGAVRDHILLRRALDAVTYPDLQVPAERVGNSDEIADCLQRLTDFKDGIYLPLISDMYNKIAFDGRVLPQPVIDSLALKLTGGQPRSHPRL